MSSFGLFTLSQKTDDVSGRRDFVSDMAGANEVGSHVPVSSFGSQACSTSPSVAPSAAYG